MWFVTKSFLCVTQMYFWHFKKAFLLKLPPKQRKFDESKINEALVLGQTKNLHNGLSNLCKFPFLPIFFQKNDAICSFFMFFSNKWRKNGFLAIHCLFLAKPCKQKFSSCIKYSEAVHLDTEKNIYGTRLIAHIN